MIKDKAKWFQDHFITAWSYSAMIKLKAGCICFQCRY